MELADHRSFTGVADVLSAFAAMYGAQVCAAESASCSGSCFEWHKCRDRERRRRVLTRFAEERKRHPFCCGDFHIPRLGMRGTEGLQAASGSFNFSKAAALLLQQIVFDPANALGRSKDLLPVGVAFSKQNFVSLRWIRRPIL